MHNFIIITIILVASLVKAKEPYFCIDNSLHPKNGCISGSYSSWYSDFMLAFNEQSFINIEDTPKETYRFTWLRTYHSPYCFIISFNPDSSATLVVKKTDGKGGYSPGNLIVNDTLNIEFIDAKHIRKLIRKSKFWSLNTNDNRIGCDGSEWIFEGKRFSDYHLVRRWTPQKGNLKKIGVNIIKFASIEEREIY